MTAPPVQTRAPVRATGISDTCTISRDYAGSIAESMFGPIEWLDADTGYCRCPGEQLHTHSTGKCDCEVFIRGVPTLHCFHASCSGTIAEANHKLRSAVGKAKHAGSIDARWKPSPADIARRRVKEGADKLKVRAKASLSHILRHFPVYLPDLWEASPVRLDGDLRHEWQLHLQLFSPDDVVWIGDKYDSASQTAAEWKKVKAARHFRPVSEWLKEPVASDNFISPAVWKPGSTSRCNEAVIQRKFLVIESDSRTRDEMLSIVAWCQQFMLLRAIVDTGGKSLHGWFDFPDEPNLEELKLILPRLGCDPALFKPAQPCRLPGVWRTERSKLQHLIYLDLQKAR